MHPTHVEITPRFIAGFLPQPVIDYPQDTTRAAVDLVFSGTLRACPDVDVILSHAGGTLPYIASRALNVLFIPPIAARAGVTAAQAQEDMGRFYHDIALVSNDVQFDALLSFVKDPSRLLYGSDFPYAGMPLIMKAQGIYKAYLEGSGDKAAPLRPETLRGNAIALLNNHSLGRVYE